MKQYLLFAGYKLLNSNFKFLIMMFITALIALPLKAQVVIGNLEPPHSFSVLELTTINRDGGLRLPRLTTSERDLLKLGELTDPVLVKEARGLVIYNITTNCLEFWNSERWVSLCGNFLPEYTATHNPNGGTSGSQIIQTATNDEHPVVDGATTPVEQ